jgi:putative heme-binding domain-containing protein
MLTLHAMGSNDREFLLRQLAHGNEHIRAWAIRMLTDNWPLDDIFGPTKISMDRNANVVQEANELMDRFCEIAATDASGLVRLALASTIQRLPVPMRTRLATPLVARSIDADDHNIPLLIWYGLIPVAESHAKQLAVIAINCWLPKTQRLVVRRLAENIDQNEASVHLVLQRVSQLNEVEEQLNILRGIEDGLRGWRQAPKPTNWDSVVAAVRGTKNPSLETIVRNLSVVFGDGRAMDEVRRIVLDESADVGLRRSALETMIASQAAGLRETCFAVLDDARLNVVAARGLAAFDDPEIGSRLVRNYRRFRSPERPKVISVLVSRKSFAAHLVDAIEDKRIPVEDLSAFDVRQIRSLGDDELFHRVTEAWGNIRDSSEEKRQQIDRLLVDLSPDVIASGNPSRGRELFNKTCSKCHRMYGVGENIGPDLTGSNRNNINYLLENILDPSAVVNKDFRMSIVETNGGQVFNGLVVNSTDKSLTIQTQTDLLTLAKEDIADVTLTSLSPMPDGLLDNLSDQEVKDLIAYLMSPSQVE